MLKTLFLLTILCRLTSCNWSCGGVLIADEKQCKCGHEVFTKEKQDKWSRQCCGPDTCYIDGNGDAVCQDGVPCNTSKSMPWNCGDVLIAQDKTCLCGSSSLSYRQHHLRFRWCCPSAAGQCFYNEEDGSAVCHNATVIKGRNNGCDGGVCYNRDYLSCRSGNQCVDKDYTCHGQPVCSDGSDVDMCGPMNKDVCPPNFYYTKCSADFAAHQECYDFGLGGIDNQEYDCITRGDETYGDTLEQIVDYNSITPCSDQHVATGLMCGQVCVDISKWCSRYSVPCSTFYANSLKLTSFNTDSPKLCQNRTFWKNISCDKVSRLLSGDFVDTGDRCTGRQQQCIYPNTTDGWLPTSCADKSDEVVQENIDSVKLNRNNV